MAIIQEQAETAFDFSTRLIQNDTVTDEDPPYIFKVSEKEERLIHTLKAIFLWGATNHSSPDGLIFSYNAFIERTDQSIYAYCNNLEQLIYKNNSLLHMKACDLQKRGDHQEATALLEICSEIKNLCNQNQASVGDKNTVYQINNILQQGSQRAEINNHKGLKEILVNCMISFSIIGLAYLAATTNQRDSFWYKTNTDRRNKIEYFSQDIQPLSGNPKI